MKKMLHKELHNLHYFTNINIEIYIIINMIESRKPILVGHLAHMGELKKRIKF
jgi:hypothetical protein